MISGIQPSCATNKHRCWTNLYCLKRHGFWRLKRIRLSFQVSHSSSSSSWSCCCVSATTDIHSLMVSHHLLHSSCHFCEVLYLPQCSHMFPYWIGLREMLQETIDFPMKIMGLSCKFSLKPIHWVKTPPHTPPLLLPSTLRTASSPAQCAVGRRAPLRGVLFFGVGEWPWKHMLWFHMIIYMILYIFIYFIHTYYTYYVWIM